MGALCAVVHVVTCRYRLFTVAEPLQDTTDIAACSSYNLVKPCIAHPCGRDSRHLCDDLHDVLFPSRSHSRNFYNCYLLLTCIFVPIPADIKADGVKDSARNDYKCHTLYAFYLVNHNSICHDTHGNCHNRAF